MTRKSASMTRIETRNTCSQISYEQWNNVFDVIMSPSSNHMGENHCLFRRHLMIMCRHVSQCTHWSTNNITSKQLIKRFFCTDNLNIRGCLNVSGGGGGGDQNLKPIHKPNCTQHNGAFYLRQREWRNHSITMTMFSFSCYRSLFYCVTKFLFYFFQESLNSVRWLSCYKRKYWN